jgi:DNA-binding transcriptional LysR family regulator
VDLNALQTFVVVVRCRGFAAAARQIGMPRSTVSLRIRNLERALGVRLFKRSTRSFALTAEGSALYERSAAALLSLNEAIADVRADGDNYQGEIRLTVPADFPSGLLAAAIAEYRGRYPGVRFEVLLTNHVLDLVSDNVDIALRIGAANPQDALVKGVLDMAFGFFASADYLQRQGMPSDLRAATTLIGPRQADLLRLLSAAMSGTALPQFHVAADSFALVRELVLRGHGIGLLPAGLCAQEIASGAVLPVLPEQVAGVIRLHLTYPSRADLSPKVAAFARILESHFPSRSS